jgi:hypothetical protein
MWGLNPLSETVPVSWPMGSLENLELFISLVLPIIIA